MSAKKFSYVKFSDAMSELDDNYITEAIRYKKKTVKSRIIKWGALAACLCLLVSGGLLYRAEHPYPTKELPLPSGSGSASEIAEVPRWEDLEIYAQYSELLLDQVEYQAGKGEVPTERLGENLGSVTARGWDEYAAIAGEDANRYCGATLYEIQNISVQCAVAVQYEGTETCYAAVNSSYRPKTLGQFVEDLDLQNTLVVNWASLDYEKPLSGHASIRFEDIDMDKVFDLLLSNASAKNEYDDLAFSEPGELLGLSVSLPLLGYENISISVREDGYLVTNILSTGKMFQVGEEHTQAFVDYVLKKCQGYEIIYVSDPGGDGRPE